MIHTAQMLFLVTGICNMNCPHCAQGWWRKDHREYHMSPDEIRFTCQRIGELGLHFGQAMVMGGEPALWKHLEAGCRVLKESGVFDSVHIYSNCKIPSTIIKMLDKGLADAVVTQTVNMAESGVDKIKEKHADKVSVTQQPEHWIHPEKIIDGVRPAMCGCDQLTVFDWRMYSCPGAYHNTVRLGLDIDNPALWVRLRDDWKTFFEKMDRYSIAACGACLANGRIGKMLAIGSKRGDLK
jgi:hypothetical protein